MELPRPWNDNVFSYSAMLSRLTIPKGVGYHKPAHSKLWARKGSSSSKGVALFKSVHPSTGK